VSPFEQLLGLDLTVSRVIPALHAKLDGIKSQLDILIDSPKRGGKRKRESEEGNVEDHKSAVVEDNKSAMMEDTQYIAEMNLTIPQKINILGREGIWFPMGTHDVVDYLMDASRRMPLTQVSNSEQGDKDIWENKYAYIVIPKDMFARYKNGDPDWYSNDKGTKIP